jgi:branched-chain amino acid transport system substrate-binding protein
MNHPKKMCVLVMIIAMIVLFLIAPGSVLSETKRITIGAVEPITGPISLWGIGCARGYEMYFDMVNEAGGIKIGNDRYLIDFKYEDNKGNPEASATAARKLVQRDGATYIFGAILESSSAAIYGVTSPANVLQLMTWVNITGHAADVGPKKPLLARPMISPHDSHTPILNYLVEEYPQAKTIVVSAPNIGYEPMIERLRVSAKKRGLEVVAVEKWEWGTEDFVPVYLKAMSHKPDVAWAMINGQANYQLRAAREIGYKGVFVSDGSADAKMFVDVAGPDAVTDVICAGLDYGFTTPAMKDVIKRYEKKYGEEFNTPPFFGWEEASVLIQAMEKAQSVDPAKVLSALETMTKPGDIKNIYGPAHIGGLKDFGVNRILVRPIPVTHIMKGKTKVMKLIMPELD